MPRLAASFYDVYVLDAKGTGPIEISERELGRVIHSASETKLGLPITGATPKVDTGGPWRQ